MHICRGVLFHHHVAPYTASLFAMKYTQRFEEKINHVDTGTIIVYKFQNLKKYIESTYPDHQQLFHCTSEVISSEDVHGDAVVLELPGLKEVEQLGYILESDKEPCSVSMLHENNIARCSTLNS